MKTVQMEISPEVIANFAKLFELANVHRGRINFDDGVVTSKLSQADIIRLKNLERMADEIVVTMMLFIEARMAPGHDAMIRQLRAEIEKVRELASPIKRV